MSTPRALPAGPRAVLFEYESLDDVMGAVAALGRRTWPGIVEIVPAARTVLVVHDGSGTPDDLVALLHHPENTPPPPALHVDIPVRYDGDDLPEVAERAGLSVTDVVSLHSSAEYQVAFCGFVPGFAYLVGLPHALRLPRRSTPRPVVPAGSVAIASEYTAVYPRATPGGWHLLGTTDVILWDDILESPALLPPGATVRFVPA